MSDATNSPLTPRVTQASGDVMDSESTMGADGLARRIGPWTAIAILVGSTIGSGIFRSPAGIADKVPGPLPIMAIWVTAGLFVLCGALTLAEVSGAYPRTGGVYVFIREAWGRLPAYLFGWAELVMIRAAALGAISTTFAEYLIRVTGNDPSLAPYSTYTHWVAAAAIFVAGSINYVGVKRAGALVNLATAAKVLGLLTIIMLAFLIGLPRTGGHYTPAVPSGSFTFAAFGLALVSVLWVYDGWADVSFVAGEVENPKRNLPRVLIIGTLSIIGIYLLANLAYLAVLPVSEIRTSPLVAADVAERLMGRPGVTFVAIVVMISTFGTLSAVMITGPRIIFATAADGMLFKPLAKVHPRFGTPYVSIATVTTIGVLFVLMGTFEQLADAFVTAIVPFYAMAVASIYVLRKRPGYAPGFRVPFYPVVPALFVIAIMFLLVNAIIDESSRWPTLGVIGGILLGIPVYYMTVGRRRA
jgi:APA family basic amino acid/polyamine antiporter